MYLLKTRISIESDRFFHLLLLALLLIAVPKSLGTFSADDYVHRTIIQGSESLYGSGVELARPDRSLGAVSDQLFDFVSDRQNIQELKKKGILPWWADDELKVSFWRPVSAATHWLDYQLWPESPMAMKLHSVFWLLILLVGLRQLFLVLGLSNSVTNLALLIYAFDLSFMNVVNWIANRNALIATAFGVYATVHCLRWLHHGQPVRLFTALLLFGLSLLSAEFGVSTFGFILAATVLCGRVNSGARWATFFSFFLVIIFYRLAYEAGGYGASFSGFYLDPLGDPWLFIQSVLVNLPLLVLSYFTGLDGALNVLSPGARAVVAAAAVVALAVAAGYGLKRRLYCREGLFLLCGALMALVPVSGVPLISGRVLLFFAIGGSVLLAWLILNFIKSHNAGKTRSMLSKGLMGYVLLVHIILGPLAWSAGGMVKLVSGVSADKKMYNLPATLNDKAYLLLNQPVVLPYLYYPFYQDYRGAEALHSVHVLAPSANDYAIRRQSGNEILIENPEGFEIFRDGDASPLVGFENVARTYDSLFRTPHRPLRPGYRVQANGISYQVMQTNADGQPTEILISFSDLNDFQWVYWSARHQKYITIDPPGVGETAMVNPRHRLPQT